MDSMSEAGQSPIIEVVIASDTAEARRVQEEIEQLLKRHQYGERDIFGIRLALEEALINAIKHGNQMDRARKVHIAYRLEPGHFEVHVTDEGSGFDPCDVPDPCAPENLERPCGRGLMLMRHYMSEVRYNDRGNAVVMSKLFRNGTKT